MAQNASYQFDDISTTLRLIAEKGEEAEAERANTALALIEERIEAMKKEQDDAASYSSLQAEKAKSAPTPVTARSIFDDLTD
jgi:hypothetical protein